MFLCVVSRALVIHAYFAAFDSFELIQDILQKYVNYDSILPVGQGVYVLCADNALIAGVNDCYKLTLKALFRRTIYLISPGSLGWS